MNLDFIFNTKIYYVFDVDPMSYFTPNILQHILAKQASTEKLT
jgi:alpha-mannosidase